MVMSVLEIVIISAGLSLDVFVAMAYMGAGFSKINKKNLIGLCLLFGGVQWGCLIVGNLLTLLPIFRDSSNSSSRIADHWEAVTVLIFIGLGIYMIWKGLKKRNILERRNDEIDWKKTTFLALVTSVDAFLAGIGMGFLEAQMIHQSLAIFPITVLSVICGVYAGYMLGAVHNSQAYLAGGALFLIAGADVVIKYCMY